MTRDITLQMQYNKDSVFVFEEIDGVRYELVRWTKDDLEASPSLPETVDAVREMVEESPRGLVQKLYGSVEEWDNRKENRKLTEK